MRRAMLHCVLIGLLTGLVGGLAAFGLPFLPAGDGPALPLGLGLHGAVVAAGAAALAAAALAALADLRRAARARRI